MPSLRFLPLFSPLSPPTLGLSPREAGDGSPRKKKVAVSCLATGKNSTRLPLPLRFLSSLSRREETREVETWKDVFETPGEERRHDDGKRKTEKRHD